MEMKDILKQHVDAFEEKLAGNDRAIGEVRAMMNEIEQKLARAPGSEPSSPITAGKQFVDSEEVKNFVGNATAGRRIGVEVKSTITSATGSGAGLFAAERDTSLMLPQRSLRVRDLLPVISVTSGNVEYARQTARTNSAATVAENTLKPESGITFDLVQVPIRTIAHWTIASRQILDDAPQLQGMIDNELLYGLGYVEDNQLLNGAGTGTDLNGIYTQATAFAAGSLGIANPTKIDAILAAILQNSLADLPADGIVLHPSDWTGIRATKTANGEYIMGPPGADVQPSMFGLPVVASPAMTAGSFLVGNFKGSATMYDRQTARVEVSTEDSDNFRRNLVTLLAEERVGLAVKRPTGFTKGTFAAAITDLTS